MFLTPEGAPFFAGTYFPKQGRYGLPGFLELLPQGRARPIASKAIALAEQSRRLADALQSLEPEGGAGAAARRARRRSRSSGLKRQLRSGSRRVRSRAQVSASVRARVLPARVRAATATPDALAIVRTTLDRMADGGIHDQLGGGFCRYSRRRASGPSRISRRCSTTTGRCSRCTPTSRGVTGERRYADVARGIVGWLVREMRADDGAFYSSLDADSEGEEGKFYVWTRDEARAAADRRGMGRRRAVLRPRRSAQLRGPRVEPARGGAARATSRDGSASTLPDAQTRLVGARAALFAAREQRIRPGRDDKILTSWNALAIAGLARAARCARRCRAGPTSRSPRSTRSKRTAWRDGRLLATRRGDRADLNAYLDDHAFLLAALVELMQTRFRREDFDWAGEIADALLDAVRGSRARRLLLHEPRPRKAVPSHQAGARQRHAVGQRRRGAGADRVRPPRRRAALRRRRGARRARCSRRRSRNRPAGIPRCSKRRGAGSAARVGAAGRRSREPCAHGSARSPRVTARGTSCSICRRPGDVPPALVKGAAPARGAVALVCRGSDVPAADGARSTACSTELDRSGRIAPDALIPHPEPS